MHDAEPARGPIAVSSDARARRRVLIFDSGLGGLSVHRAIRGLRPDLDTLYLADDACFPYGALTAEALVPRVLAVIGDAAADFRPDCIVIACNTASTLVLPPLRARYSVPIVGTVPAIKPAAARTLTGMVSVLATPGTVSRDYTADLIRRFAAGVDVTLVGSAGLAGLVEQALAGEPVADAAVLAEIAPCFVEKPGRDGASARTDVVVLACTHYPLILDRLARLAPWPVAWIDPAPAIARRVVEVLGAPQAAGMGRDRVVSTAPASRLAEHARRIGALAAPPAPSARAVDGPAVLL